MATISNLFLTESFRKESGFYILSKWKCLAIEFYHKISKYLNTKILYSFSKENKSKKSDWFWNRLMEKKKYSFTTIIVHIHAKVILIWKIINFGYLLEQTVFRKKFRKSRSVCLVTLSWKVVLLSHLSYFLRLF